MWCGVVQCDAMTHATCGVKESAAAVVPCSIQTVSPASASGFRPVVVTPNYQLATVVFFRGLLQPLVSSSLHTVGDGSFGDVFRLGRLLPTTPPQYKPLLQQPQPLHEIQQCLHLT